MIKGAGDIPYVITRNLWQGNFHIIMHISRVEEISKFYSSNLIHTEEEERKRNQSSILNFPSIIISQMIRISFDSRINWTLSTRDKPNRTSLDPTCKYILSLSLSLEDSFKLINSSSLDYSFLPIPLPLERTTGPSRTSWSKCRTQIPFPSPDPCPIQGMTRTIGWAPT